MSNQQKTSIEQALEQVTPSRRRFLQQLLGGSAVALAIPASRLLAQPAQDGDGKGKGEGKGEGACRESHRRPSKTFDDLR